MILYFDYINPALGLFHPNYARGQTVSLSMTLLNLEGDLFSRKVHTSKEAGTLLSGGPLLSGNRYFRGARCYRNYTVPKELMYIVILYTHKLCRDLLLREKCYLRKTDGDCRGNIRTISFKYLTLTDLKPNITEKSSSI